MTGEVRTPIFRLLTGDGKGSDAGDRERGPVDAKAIDKGNSKLRKLSTLRDLFQCPAHQDTLQARDLVVMAHGRAPARSAGARKCMIGEGMWGRSEDTGVEPYTPVDCAT